MPRGDGLWAQAGGNRQGGTCSCSSCCMAAAGSPCWPSAAARAAEAALGSSEPSMLKVDSSSWSKAATVRSSREKDSEGFIPLGPAWSARVPMVPAVQRTAFGLELG